MQTDSFFRQGSGHAVCQDYAINGENEDIAFALVADGCSSSPKTDVGARILAESFTRTICEVHKPSWSFLGEKKAFVSVETLGRVKRIKEMLTLSSNSFDATLLAAVFDKHANELGLYIWGDGFVRLEYEGKHENWRITYPKNAPYYLSYLLKPDRLKAYLEEFPENQAALFRHIQFAPWKEGSLALCGQETEALEPLHFQQVSAEGLKSITVFSDGLESFSKVDEDNEVRPISYTEIFTEAVAYKSHSGNFVQRRMLAMAKNSAKLGRSHYDDVSAAAISFV